MILLIYIVKQKQTRKRERVGGGESKPRGGHLPLGDVPISSSAA